MKKFFAHTIEFLLTVYLLVCSIPSASAAGTESTSDTFTLSIQCSFSNDEDNVQENYEENLFLVFDTQSNLYIVASIDPETGYRVTGYTADQDSATKFTPAQCSSQPGKLVIQNLPASAYSISQIQTSEGYMVLTDPVRLDVSQSADNSFHATVDESEVDSSNGYIEFYIKNIIPFHLPMCPCWECRLMNLRIHFPVYLVLFLIIACSAVFIAISLYTLWKNYRISSHK